MTAKLPTFVVESHELVQSYGATLEETRGMVRDIKLLPASKQAIKASLIILLTAERNTEQREFLKGGYVYLAHFQSLTDSERASIEQYERSAAVKAGSTGKNHLLDALTAWPLYKALVERRFAEEALLTSDLATTGLAT